MVKRQTVWLSTMMVLSLMLIGYYTINSGGSSASTTTDNSVATASVNPPANATSNSSSTNNSTANDTNSSKATNETNSPGASKSMTASDWFVQSRTQVEQNMTQTTDLYEQIMSNNSSTNTEVAQAQQDLEQVQAIQGGMQNARDAILGDGYKDAVIFPNLDSKTGDLTSVSVYVQASKLSPSKAVEIMNIVSQHMNVPLDTITVHEHA